MKTKKIATTFALFASAALLVGSMTSCRTGHFSDTAKVKTDQKEMVDVTAINELPAELRSEERM